MPLDVYHSEVTVMLVNGTEVSIEGRSRAEVMSMLVDASPNKDGVGLRVEFTAEEEWALARYIGLPRLHRALFEGLVDAVIESGVHQKGMTLKYSDRVMTTTEEAPAWLI